MSRAKSTPPGVVLRGQRNCCPTCGELFARTSGFAKHRVGSFAEDTRRCLTVPEMQERGFQREVAWFWRLPAPAGVAHWAREKSAGMAIPEGPVLTSPNGPLG